MEERQRQREEERILQLKATQPGTEVFGHLDLDEIVDGHNMSYPQYSGSLGFDGAPSSRNSCESCGRIRFNLEFLVSDAMGRHINPQALPLWQEMQEA